ncbi:hypothetical protein V6C03_03030 [Methyloligella sp. 2.7D]|uniref:hypothetical protein n=1 Tax=unclassified Methyloligella TaxID=2625955 RepID=UPI00157BFCBB|nr:hypothetical protein [Methyloligella sp. GL2]QKP76403.1 hypothetical protein HT051_02390 [Methyloligella sp. GL2]
MASGAAFRALAIAAFTLWSAAAIAEEPPEPLADEAATERAAVPEKPEATERPPKLTPAEKAEKQSRMACKIEICSILKTQQLEGPDVACDIVKTWREKDIEKMTGGHVSWPWGKAVCRSKLKLERAALAKAMSRPNFQVSMETQTVRCALYRKGGKPYQMRIDLSPKVTFKNGKAREASINWGEMDAPTAIYPVIYAGTGLDNSSNFLGPVVVDLVNEFTTKKCAEVKRELPEE